MEEFDMVLSDSLIACSPRRGTGLPTFSGSSLPSLGRRVDSMGQRFFS